MHVDPRYFASISSIITITNVESQYLFPSKDISPKDTETPVESPIPIPPSSSEGSSLPVRMPPKRTSTSAVPAMNQAAIRQLIVDRVAAALEAQAANMANIGSEGAIGLICWFELTKSVFSHSSCTEDWKELATLCPTMVSNSEKLLEAFIRGLPRSIEGNVSTSKPHTLKEAINISQWLVDQ
nr:reverse transcriptase domain-containing protein [Tanacetum cinerariifolium]